jgi:hypothetical protein
MNERHYKKHAVFNYTIILSLLNDTAEQWMIGWLVNNK